MKPWVYKGQDFTKDDGQRMIDEGYIGFVYEILDLETNKKYIGKKMLISKVKLKPLKGQKRRRLKIGHSDWEKYYGSSEYVKTLVEERRETIHREILMFCKGKGELNYREAELQFAKGVLLSEEYMNGIINCRINKKHVSQLKLFTDCD